MNTRIPPDPRASHPAGVPAFVPRARFHSWIACVGLVIVLPVAYSQELYGGWGAMYTPTISQSSTREFEIGYRYDLNVRYALSVAMLNEGHVTGHHRDGFMGEVWRNWPWEDNRWSLSAGAAAYSFFDTQGRTPYDIHGMAFVTSLMLTYYTDSRAFFRITGNAVIPGPNIKTVNLDIGGGIWLGRERRPFAAPPPLGQQPVATTSDATRNLELTALFGWSIENVFNGDHRLAYAFESRWLGHWSWARFDIPRQPIDYTVSYINEHKLGITRRQGVAAQVWPASECPFGDGRLRIAIGIGAYSAIGPRNDIPKGQYFTPVIAPFFTFPMISYRWNDFFVRAQFNRVTGYHDADADVILLGAGWRF